MRLGWQCLRTEDKEAIFRAVFADPPDAPGPFHLEIDPFDACNANCAFCISKEIRHGAALDWPLLRRLLEDAAARGLRSIRLSGGGEPTLYPHFTDLLDWAEARGIVLDNLTTNGLRLSGPLAGALLRTPPTFLVISLNYATAAGYARQMGLGPERYAELCANIRRFVDRLHEAGRTAACQVHVQFMLDRRTLEELPAMFERAAGLGVYGMTIRGIQNQPSGERLTAAERRRFLEEVTPLAWRYNDRFWIMFDLGCEGLGAETAALSAALHARHLPAGPAPDPRLDACRFCLMPWYSMAVLGSGVVYPCCMLLHGNAVRPLGDVRTQPLAAVWNGPAFRRLRGEVRRSMLLGGPVPVSRRLCRHTVAACWVPGGCALPVGQLDQDDLTRLSTFLDAYRATPSSQVKTLFYRTLRKSIDRFRGSQ